MKSIKVTILGKQYPLKVKDGHEETMKEIAAFVDQRFRDFKSKLTSQNEPTIMTLAALSIAEDLFLEKDQNAGSSENGEAVMAAVNSSITELLADIKHKNADLNHSR